MGTILMRGPNDHTIRQIKDALHDGLRAINNVIVDKSLIPGAGAFEIAAYHHLMKFKQTVKGRAKLGVQAFADALLIIPKTLANNSGLDQQTCILTLLDESQDGSVVGLDITTGKAILPETVGIWDNHRVKKQFLHLGSLIAIKLLLVDEVIRAGKNGQGLTQAYTTITDTDIAFCEPKHGQRIKCGRVRKKKMLLIRKGGEGVALRSPCAGLLRRVPLSPCQEVAGALSSFSTTTSCSYIFILLKTNNPGQPVVLAYFFFVMKGVFGNKTRA